MFMAFSLFIVFASCIMDHTKGSVKMKWKGRGWKVLNKRIIRGMLKYGQGRPGVKPGV